MGAEAPAAPSGPQTGMPRSDSKVVMRLGSHGVPLSPVPEHADGADRTDGQRISRRVAGSSPSSRPEDGSPAFPDAATLSGMLASPHTEPASAEDVTGSGTPEHSIVGLRNAPAGEADAALRGFMSARARNATAASFGQSWTEEGHVVIYSNSSLLKQFVQEQSE